MHLNLGPLAWIVFKTLYVWSNLVIILYFFFFMQLGFWSYHFHLLFSPISASFQFSRFSVAASLHYQFLSCPVYTGVEGITVATASKDRSLRLWKVIGKSQWALTQIALPPPIILGWEGRVRSWVQISLGVCVTYQQINK